MSCDYVSNLSTIRATKVDSCGKPIAGPNAYVTSCVATLAMNVVTDDQDDRIFRAANGTLCAVKRGCKTLLGYDIELTVLQSSPQLVEILTGNPGYLDSSGALVGTDDCSIQCTSGFALEFWMDLVDPDCTDPTQLKSLYGVIPWVTNSYISDLEVGSDAVNFLFTGTSRAGGQWGTGPFDVVRGAADAPAKMTTALGATCHRRLLTTTLPIPTGSCEFVTVPVIP